MSKKKSTRVKYLDWYVQKKNEKMNYLMLELAYYSIRNDGIETSDCSYS